MSILVIGGEGQLGTTINEIVTVNAYAGFHFTTMPELDLSAEENVRRFFEGRSYTHVINCSAYTAVDKAESEVENAHLINALAPGWIGKYAAQAGAAVIHISTDYVFDGTGNIPLTPDTVTNPVSIYGQSKLDGEKHLQKFNPATIIIRTSWLYSLHGHNFLNTMLRLGKEKKEVNVVFDQVGTPTSAYDLAKAIIEISRKSSINRSFFVPGIYHYSNEGVCSWFDFATMIFKLTNSPCKVNPVRSSSFPVVARRPCYSVLDKSKIKSQFELEIPYWVNSLEETIARIGK